MRLLGLWRKPRGSKVQVALVELRRACKAENVDYGSVLRAERLAIVLDRTRQR